MKRGTYSSLISIIALLNIGLLGCTPNPANSLTSRELVDQCTTDMATTFHIHSHLTIMVEGKNFRIPAEIGIQNGCMSSLHTHNTTGIIHIEAPVQKDFTLGDFFYKWGKPLSANQVLSYKIDTTHGLKLFVNGKESTEFENLILTDDQEIFLDYYQLSDGPDPLPDPYDFAAEDL